MTMRRPGPTAAPIGTAPAREDGTHTWLHLLAVLAGVVAVGDVVFMALIPTLIPPLALAATLTLVGVALLGSRPRASLIVLGLTSVVMLLIATNFLPHLAHPGSPIDFLHAVLAVGGRALAVAAAVAAWRNAADTQVRRVSTVGLGLAGLAVVIASVTTLATSGETARSGDLSVVITGSQFPATVVIEQGRTLHLDNQDRFRHTFTVAGRALDVELPASTGVRATVELPPGTYAVICDIRGHEHMTSVLEVQG